MTIYSQVYYDDVDFVKNDDSTLKDVVEGIFKKVKSKIYQLFTYLQNTLIKSLIVKLNTKYMSIKVAKRRLRINWKILIFSITI